MTYISDNDDEFGVFERGSISNILLGMAKARTPVNATFNAGMEVLLTVVLDVDQKGGWVYLDVNANDEINKHMVHSKRVSFQAFFAGAKIMWNNVAVQDSSWEGGRAFRVAIPDRLQRIQRRGSYRVNTPITNPVMCKITVNPKLELSMPLFDICIEGIGVILPETPDPSFVKLANFKHCRLEHADFGVLEVSLFVKSMWEITLKNNAKAQRAGLEFTNLMPGIQNKIQRYVYQLERQLMATRAL